MKTIEIYFLVLPSCRYITLPGQACAYKIGERKILELKDLAIHQLEESFDSKEFHKTVLDCPGPLNVLEICVRNWLKTKESKPNGGEDDLEVDEGFYEIPKYSKSNQIVLTPKEGFLLRNDFNLGIFVCRF